MITTYMFNKVNRKNIMNTQREAISIIKSFFLSAFFGAAKNAKMSQNIEGQMLVGKPLFTVSPNKVIVQVFYYGNTCTNYQLSLLGNALAQC